MDKYEGLFFIGLLVLLSLFSYFNHKEKMVRLQTPQVITGGLCKDPRHKVDSLFNDFNYAGDTACFKMRIDTTIELQCVCSCEKFRKIKR